MEKLERIGRVSHALRFIFKAGLPLGVGFLVLGTIVVGPHEPQQFGYRVPPRVAAIGETTMALACAAEALVCLLNGYISLRGGPTSVRISVSVILAHTLGTIILASGAIVLGVLGFRDWLRP